MKPTNNVQKRVFSFANPIPHKKQTHPIMVDVSTGTDSPVAFYPGKSELFRKRLLLYRVNSNKKPIDTRNNNSFKGALAPVKSQNGMHSSSMSLPVCNYINFIFNKNNNSNSKIIHRKKQQQHMKIYSYNSNCNSCDNIIQYKQPQVYNLLSKERKINRSFSRNISQPSKYNANTFSLVNLPFKQPNNKNNSNTNERIKLLNGKYFINSYLKMRNMLNIKSNHLNIKNNIFDFAMFYKQNYPTMKLKVNNKINNASNYI